jgi:hypothetical protein
VMGDLEFSAQTGHLGRMPVTVVENFQRARGART